MLQVFIPILLIGVVLPIGLPAFVLNLDGAPLKDAISHGELFLAGGNMAFTSSVMALAMRPDRALNVASINSVVWATVVMPSYYGWVHIATSAAREEASPAAEAVISWGLVSLAAGLIATIVLVACAFVRPSATEGASSGGSATLRG